MKWYKHDTAANMDAKLQEVMFDYGLEGYGLYWYCLELIAANVAPGNLTFELEHDARIIARNTGNTPQKVQEMMTRFIDLGLFENDNGRITCLKLAKKVDDYTSKLTRKKIGLPPHSGHAPDKLPSLTGQSPPKGEEKRTDKNRTDKKKIKETSADKPADHCPHKKIVALYHENLPELPGVKEWTEARKANLRSRWRSDTKRQNLDWWDGFFKHIASSDFLNGRVDGRNGVKPFLSNIDWILNPNNFAKILEGNYHNSEDS